MPEVGEHNIGAEILLPKGDKMARDHVVAWSHNANGNIMGRAYMNPNLDTRAYQVEFAEGEGTELTINIMAESMSTQCNADGTEDSLLDVLVDYHKDN